MFTQIAYGGDYYPEQWNPEVWQEDVRLMQEAGVNRVSVGIFAWARLEPEPGRFDFSWLRQVIDLLWEHGVSVNLATPTASPPPWFSHRYPESLPVMADGTRLWHGSRRHMCPNSPDYRRHAREIVTRLVQEFGDHPALALWHVDNEYACHYAECHCEVSQAAFRRWLQQRYGSLEALNEAWGTDFWSQVYRDWEEIRSPGPMPTLPNPAQKLDWQRFTSDAWLECFQEQIDILREYTPEIPLTTNFMRFHRPLDYWKWAEREDLVSLDDYPEPDDPLWMARTAMLYDLMRSLKHGQPWLLMEQATAHVNWREHNTMKRPGVMRLGSYQALARGANGIMFFQWRASKSGSEKFHSAMVSHAGTGTRVWWEVKELGSELKRLNPLLPGRIQAEVAILFDWENWWALEGGGKPANDLVLLPRLTDLYLELYRRNISVNFAHPEADLSAYKLVLAPHLYLVSEETARNIERYVAQGGAFWTNFFSGMVDSNEQVWLGGYPAPFRKVLGVWVEEYAPLGEAESNRVKTVGGKEFACDFWIERIHLEGAESLADFCEDYVAGSPAVTRHRYGKGTGYYLGTSLDRDGLSWMVEHICRESGVQMRADLPAGVECTRRVNGEQAWVFVLNYSKQPVEMQAPAAGVDLISGEEVGGMLRLEPYGAAVIQVKADAG